MAEADHEDDEDGRLVVESARAYTLADIRARVAAEGPLHPGSPVTVEGRKAGLAEHVKAKHGKGGRGRR